MVEVPPYNKKTSCPVQVQFYVSNGKRRKSLTQSFTYLPGVRHYLPTATGVKQEHWEPDHISHIPPGFCPPSCQGPSHDRVLGSDVAYYNSCVPPVHCVPLPQSTTRLHHPPSSVPLQTTLMFSQASSLPIHSSSMPSETSSVLNQILNPLQTSAMSLQTYTIHPQTSVPPQLPTNSPQVSSLPPQTFTIPPPTSSGRPQREQSPPIGTFETPTDSQKDSLLSSPGEALSIKQEPEDQPNLGSLGLQEITLDDGRSLF